MATSALARAERPGRGRAAALDDGRLVVGHDELAPLVEEEGDWLAAGGERFGLLADNGVGWAIADLALHARRLPCVPLPGFFTAGQLQHAFDDAGIDCLVTDDPGRVRPSLAGWHTAGVSGRTGLAMFRRRLDPAARAPLPPGTVKITYTSGSTGRPKGVCLGAAQLDAVARSLALATESLGIERHLCLLPLATLLENIAGIHAPLSVGASCLLPPSSVTGMSYAGPDVHRLLGCISRAAPQSIVLVPELLRLLVSAVEVGWQAPGSLKFVAVGGAPVSLDLLERAERAGLPVFEGYGLSECASVVCLNTPEARRRGSVGRPLPHVRVRVADDGQVMVSGATLLGYLGQPPRPPGEEWATGDLGELDEEGYLYVHGRIGNLFITSLGRNIAPEWVEREIAQQPGVRQVLVHGEARPHAVAIVGVNDASVSDADLDHAIAAANARLPEYAQVRRWARIPEPFSLENGLLTSNGRLRRREILERHGALIASLYDPTPERGDR
jgi:long-subunit acyl-CoA synthetase (AMP-forming)